MISFLYFFFRRLDDEPLIHNDASKTEQKQQYFFNISGIVDVAELSLQQK